MEAAVKKVGKYSSNAFGSFHGLVNLLADLTAFAILSNYVTISFGTFSIHTHNYLFCLFKSTFTKIDCEKIIWNWNDYLNPSLFWLVELTNCFFFMLLLVKRQNQYSPSLSFWVNPHHSKHLTFSVKSSNLLELFAILFERLLSVRVNKIYWSWRGNNGDTKDFFMLKSYPCFAS